MNDSAATFKPGNSEASMGVRRGGGKTGICPPLEIGTKKQTFLENVKSAF